jgi:tRNA (guanosine-2'-O-)-methyltransferase
VPELSDATIAKLAEHYVSEERRRRFSEVAVNRLNLCLLCEESADDRNVAACARSVEIFGGRGIHVTRNEKLDPIVGRRAARGSSRWLDVVWHEETSTAISAFRSEGYQLVGASVDAGARPFTTWKPMARVVLCMGPEFGGISDELQDACDELVHVPMYGFTQSLNLAVTAGILLQYASQAMRAQGAGQLSQEEQDALILRWCRDDLQKRFPEHLNDVAARFEQA